MTLDELRPGEQAVVSQVCGDGVFRRRLLEHGLLPGTRIERTGQSPFGDPLSYRVRGAVLCLRRADAHAIVLEAPSSASAK
jgi:ferrous iron transport protein A